MKQVVCFLILVICCVSCKKDIRQMPAPERGSCDSVEFSYEHQVKKLIRSNCAGFPCHSGYNSNYNYMNYEVIADRIRSGRFEERLLLPLSEPMHMPVGRTLDTCTLFTIRTWIHQGFKNN